MALDRPFLIIVGLAACGPRPASSTHSPTTMQHAEAPFMNDSIRGCADVARTLAAARLLELEPLGECPLDAVLGAVPALADDVDHDGELGRAYVDVSWRETSTGIAGTTFRVWHIERRVVALELEGPPMESWAALRERIGAPEAKLAYHQQATPVPDGQWVYAARGLAVFTWQEAEYLDRVVVFAPTTVDDYHDGLAMHLWPLRESPY